MLDIIGINIKTDLNILQDKYYVTLQPVSICKSFVSKFFDHSHYTLSYSFQSHHGCKLYVTGAIVVTYIICALYKVCHKE